MVPLFEQDQRRVIALRPAELSVEARPRFPADPLLAARSGHYKAGLPEFAACGRVAGQWCHAQITTLRLTDALASNSDANG
jgi:hypothetical protein